MGMAQAVEPITIALDNTHLYQLLISKGTPQIDIHISTLAC